MRTISKPLCTQPTCANVHAVFLVICMKKKDKGLSYTKFRLERRREGLSGKFYDRVAQAGS